MQVPTTIGRYRLIEPIGRGAMGAVYRAHDPQLERDVAVKIIASELASGHGDAEETGARFTREARVAARLQHPNIVAVFDAGEQDGALFLVMELVEGDSLGACMARGDFPTPTRALEIVAQAADALAAAHAAGIIHRDIKPGNLLLPRGGRVKVSDFGIAKAVGESTELTRTGTLVGSPAYMAPEQVQNLPLDGRSDLFSLGVVLFEMLLHRKPFPADTLTSLVYQILYEDPFTSSAVDLGGLRPELAGLLRWCLAKDREERAPDAATLATRARAVAATLAAAPAATAPTARLVASELAAPPRARARAHRALPWIAIASFLAVLAFAVAYRRPAPPPENLVGSRPAGVSGTESSRDGSQTLPTAEPGTPAAAPAGGPTVEVGQRATQAPSPGAPRAEAPRREAAPAAASSAPVLESESAAAVIPVSPAPVRPTPSKTFACRKGAEFHVDPEETLVTVEGRLLGKADDWDGMGGGKAYIFPGPGSYLVKLELTGYRTTWIEIVVSPSAKKEIVNVDTELEEIE